MLLMPTERQGMLMHLFGIMAVFIGITLVLCSSDLRRRGCVVLWETLLRIGGFCVMAGYGLFGGAGLPVAASGLFDLEVAVVYLVWLPRHLDVGFFDLLLDRSVSS